MPWPLFLLLAGLVSFVVGFAMAVDSTCCSVVDSSGGQWSVGHNAGGSWFVWLALLGVLAIFVAIVWLLVLGFLWVFA